MLAVRALALHLDVGGVPQTVALVAKLALTEAFHMRTADLLLDGLPAFGALSSVVVDPCQVYVLGVHQRVPFLHVATSRWRVRLLLALEAVKFTAWTVD